MKRYAPVTDLANLGEEALTMAKDDEDRLLDPLVGGEVGEGLLDVGVLHEKIAPESAPHNPLEGDHLGLLDDSSDEAHAAGPETTLAGLEIRGVTLLEAAAGGRLEERGSGIVLLTHSDDDLASIGLGLLEELLSLTEDVAELNELAVVAVENFLVLVDLADLLFKGGELGLEIVEILNRERERGG